MLSDAGSQLAFELVVCAHRHVSFSRSRRRLSPRWTRWRTTASEQAISPAISGIRALVEDPCPNGIALGHGQLSEEPVQTAGVAERRELLDPLEIAVLEDQRLVTKSRASRALDPGSAHAVEQLVLGDLEQPAAGGTAVRIEPLQIGDDRRERLGGQIERELARAGAAQVIAGDQRQPPPVELRKRTIIATCRRHGADPASSPSRYAAHHLLRTN